MTKILLALACVALALLLVQRLFFGFMAQAPEDYAETTPPFDLRAALTGPLKASGVIYRAHGPRRRPLHRRHGGDLGRRGRDAGRELPL